MVRLPTPSFPIPPVDTGSPLGSRPETDRALWNPGTGRQVNPTSLRTSSVASLPPSGRRNSLASYDCGDLGGNPTTPSPPGPPYTLNTRRVVQTEGTPGSSPVTPERQGYPSNIPL